MKILIAAGKGLAVTVGLIGLAGFMMYMAEDHPIIGAILLLICIAVGFSLLAYYEDDIH